MPGRRYRIGRSQAVRFGGTRRDRPGGGPPGRGDRHRCDRHWAARSGKTCRAGRIGRRVGPRRQEAPVSRYRRWNELLELLGTAGQLQVEYAAKALNVSAATVRRDFDALAEQQMLTRIRGGAVAQGVNYDLPLRYKTERHPSEKQRIGELSASMVRAGQ